MTKYEKAFMQMAHVFAQTSCAKRLKVGALFVKDGNILALGCNGTMPGWHTNACEDENGCTTNAVIHAEQNGILKAAKAGISLKGSTLYVTHSTCVMCSGMLYSVGVERVVYSEVYRDTTGIEWLEERRVIVEQTHI